MTSTAMDTNMTPSDVQTLINNASLDITALQLVFKDGSYCQIDGEDVLELKISDITYSIQNGKEQAQIGDMFLSIDAEYEGRTSDLIPIVTKLEEDNDLAYLAVLYSKEHVMVYTIKWGGGTKAKQNVRQSALCTEGLLRVYVCGSQG